MAPTSNTQTHQPTTAVIATIGMIYGLMAFVTVCLIARNISTFREKALRKLPTRLQENAFIKGTLQALIIVVPSLLWPLFLLPVLFTIAGNRLETENQQVPDLERRASNAGSQSGSDSDSDSEFQSDELRRRETDDTLGSRGAAPPYIHAPPYVARAPSMPSAAHIRSPARANTAMAPPAYAPYPTVLATLQTQWIQMSDRTAESYIRLLNDDDTRTTPEMTQSGSRATIPPRQR